MAINGKDHDEFLYYAIGCSDVNLDNKEYPQFEPRSF